VTEEQIREIVKSIERGTKLTIRDFAELLGYSSPGAIYGMLDTLKEDGIIDFDKNGKTRHYETTERGRLRVFGMMHIMWVDETHEYAVFCPHCNKCVGNPADYFICQCFLEE
jgi:Mn-dependent DtxR family transcriptional regulator